MTTDRKGTRVLALVRSLAAILVGFFLFVRPWYLRWGATGYGTRSIASRELPSGMVIPEA